MPDHERPSSITGALNSSSGKEAHLQQWVLPLLESGNKDRLLSFVRARRWYRSKEKEVLEIGIFDWAYLESGRDLWLLLAVHLIYRKKGEELYFVPFAVGEAIRGEAPSDENAIDIVREGKTAVYQDCFSIPAFNRWLIEKSLAGGDVPSEKGVFRFLPSGQGPAPLRPEDPVRRMKGEQSNTSLVAGGRMILKIYRMLDTAGVNPEVEMLGFLTRCGFDGVPAHRAEIFYEASEGSRASMGLLQDFVRSESDGWEYALKSFKQAAAAGDKDNLTEAGDRYLDLGRVTGEMHRTLASDPEDPAFCPEPVSSADVEDWRNSHLELMRRTLDGLERRLREIRDPSLKRLCEELFTLRGGIPEMSASLELLCREGIHKIRVHGDYHLGQVLKADREWFIVDFEGEPMRPLKERKIKSCGLKDVAGMLRSFNYAAYAASEDFLPGRGSGQARDSSGIQAAEWESRIRRFFLEGYFETCRSSVRILPRERETTLRILSAFEMEKAVYELHYELNNRPDWIAVPIRGILEILKRLKP